MYTNKWSDLYFYQLKYCSYRKQATKYEDDDGVTAQPVCPVVTTVWFHSEWGDQESRMRWRVAQMWCAWFEWFSRRTPNKKYKATSWEISLKRVTQDYRVTSRENRLPSSHMIKTWKHRGFGLSFTVFLKSSNNHWEKYYSLDWSWGKTGRNLKAVTIQR